MPPLTTTPIHFGTFLVAPQVFHLTPLSYALVNLKPLLPGHVLVCPRRVVPRLSQLTHDEVSDLFATVQKVSRMIERVYSADALNVAIQDGKAAGQSVPHLHCHVVPRRGGDMDARGGGDKIYEEMEGREGDVGRELRRRQEEGGAGEKTRSRGFGGPDADRKPRSDEEMRKEAEWLAAEMEKEVD